MKTVTRSPGDAEVRRARGGADKPANSPAVTGWNTTSVIGKAEIVIRGEGYSMTRPRRARG